MRIKNVDDAASQVAELEEQLAAQKKTFAEELASGSYGVDSDKINRFAIGIADLEGQLDAFARFALVLGNPDRGIDAALSSVMDMVLRGADDTWSGRTNDMSRAKFDGLRYAADQLKSMVDYA